MRWKTKLARYSFWILFVLMLGVMAVVMSVESKRIYDEILCLATIVLAEFVLLLIHFVCFGYKDGTCRAWISSELVVLIVAVVALVLGGIYTDQLQLWVHTHPWMILSCVGSTTFFAASHHTMLCKKSKQDDKI